MFSVLTVGRIEDVVNISSVPRGYRWLEGIDMTLRGDMKEGELCGGG